MVDEDDTGDLDELRRAAVLQWLRVAAIFGTFVGGSFGAIAALCISLAVEAVTGPMVVPIRGHQIPLLGFAQVLSVIILFKSAVEIQVDEKPEFRRIDK
jgi:hypothetical protein